MRKEYDFSKGRKNRCASMASMAFTPLVFKSLATTIPMINF
jgi:hypothetical protein